MLSRLNVRCLLVIQSDLLHLHVYENMYELSESVIILCVKNVLYYVYSELSCIILFIFNSFISPMILYFLFMNKHCLIKLSCPFLSSYSGKYISSFSNI